MDRRSKPGENKLLKLLALREVPVLNQLS
jgi:hypothetical protein